MVEGDIPLHIDEADAARRTDLTRRLSRSERDCHDLVDVHGIAGHIRRSSRRSVASR